MAAMTQNLTIEQGTTWSQTITLSPVVDLTGLAGRCQIRQYPSPLYPVIASPAIALAVDPTTGVFTMSLTAAETAAMPVAGTSHTDKTTYYYDVEMYNGSSVLRVLQGSIQVSPEVTR